MNARGNRVTAGLVVAVLVMLGGCGGGSPAAPLRISTTAPPATTAIMTPTTTSTASTAPNPSATACRSNQLQLRFDKQLGSASNQTGAFFQLRNTSDSECTLDGYPGFEAFDADGAAEDITASRGSSYLVSDPGPHLVSLSPDQAAYFGVGWAEFDVVDATPKACIDTASIASVPPNSSAALTTKATLSRICPEGSRPPTVFTTAVALMGAWSNASASP